MKTKLLTICLLLFTSQVFAHDAGSGYKKDSPWAIAEEEGTASWHEHLSIAQELGVLEETINYLNELDNNENNFYFTTEYPLNDDKGWEYPLNDDEWW